MRGQCGSVGVWVCGCVALVGVASGEKALSERAPGFELPDAAGKVVRLEEWKGRPVVLNFWAFWCDTWKEEMPHLKELAALQDDVGFKLLSISVDGTRMPEFSRRTRENPPFPVLLDVGGRISSDYRVNHVPTVVIVDSQGRIAFRCSGYPGNHVVLRELRKLAESSQQDHPTLRSSSNRDPSALSASNRRKPTGSGRRLQR